VIVRNWATFTSDLPDDHIEDEAGEEIIQYGGKSVAEAIAEMLSRLGCVVDPPRYADEHGWELDIAKGKRRLWCQITLIESYLMAFEDTSFLSSLRRPHPDFLGVLTGLAGELGNDARFHDVEWFVEKEVLSGVEGAKAPMDD
jgi:hypothetical protein